jgi:hypothetical protein
MFKIKLYYLNNFKKLQIVEVTWPRVRMILMVGSNRPRSMKVCPGFPVVSSPI